MRILIVDDHPQRYDRLVAALSAIGITREKIDLIGSTKVAREYMDRHHYDLLILDILIPYWPEGDGDAQNAIDILFEIREGEIAQPPRYVVGITSDRQAAGNALRQFEDWTWTVLDYSDAHDEWVHRATNCASFLLVQPASVDQVPPSRTDLAIICALASPEQEEVLKLPWAWEAARPIDDMVFVREGHVVVEGQRLNVCVTTAPRMGMVSTALRAASVIAQLNPRLLAMTGVCAGVRGKVKLGDVLFADPAWDFQSGKRVKDKENTQFSIRPHHLPAAAKIRSHVEQIKEDKAALAAIATNYAEEPSGIPRLVIGPLASGSAVLADGEVIKEIRAQHQELVGVEMEIYGLYAAAQAAAGLQPLVFALKGVCDFADPDKEDGHQRFAAYASARVLQLLIERYGRRLAS